MAHIISEGTLTSTVTNKIATVTFGHPASNSFPRTLLDALTAELDSLSRNDDVSVILLQSSGEKAFCAGASFDELLAVEDMEQGIHFFSGFANLINAMRRCSKIIVGRVQGKAVGGGVGIIAACDYVFATEASAIKLSEIAIGIGPFVIEPAVSRKIGKTAVTELSLAPDKWKTAQWAQQKGLYAEVVADIGKLEETILPFLEKLASYNPDALLEMKKVIWEGTENWETLLTERAKITGRLVLSDFTKKALSGFKK
ncbi:enoyl-CoA hydratase/isomerase family protein [Flavobacterium algicola]|uniref:enoyl-CoA hydratase/isomerase family protein n=1 Tax=Flavobacterium algicola TaxID=556529 RepID=UPI001EFDA79D|nr:enoyl-CoA hydratase/isomerase family protein [Flavobacterium algicola]MCG9792121.1 enoyl-CoA hydratase/isomerase family protein [Flavobacterium algicola]